LPYFDKWEQSITKRTGFEDQAKKMMITQETLHGIKVNGNVCNSLCTCYSYNFTVSSFVDLIKYVFTIPGVTVFLSERLCQDPLEKFFGCQRQRGGTNENPTVQEFCRNTQALRVVNSLCGNIKKGNCQGHKDKAHVDVSEENKPLPKRRYAHK